MRKNQKKFKGSPKRYQPKGLSILYEDRDLLVVDKASGLLTVSHATVRDQTAFYLLNDYVRKGNPKSRHRVFIVHRLDRDTSGVIVFAKNEMAKRYLQDEWQGFQKTYYAVVHGTLLEKEGVITSYLAENSAHKMYSVADPRKGKLARTGYRVVKESAKYSLLKIDLFTGRKNQIRVHLADKGCPVAGDKKYGVKEKGVKRLALHSASIALTHPFSKEKMTFESKVPAFVGTLLKGSTEVRDKP
ncbi:MAG: RNA pseudouridine synthase [Verrucomicrobia bacterium]|nr:MAG: RNA pseudouridine synthase [Verrucomicrobiota bacterium]